MSTARIGNYECVIDGDGVTITKYIGDETDVVIPETIQGRPVHRIGVMAFCNCGKLRSVIFPKNLTSIDDSAFNDCPALTSVTIPESEVQIDPWAFDGCDSLKELFFTGSEYQWGDRFYAGPEVEIHFHYDADFKPDSSEAVVLHCPTCGEEYRRQLSIHDHGSFEGARIAAFRTIDWGKAVPEPGSVVTVTADFPFFCKTGECFASEHRQERNVFLVARLLRIISLEKTRALMRVKVIAAGQLLSFAQKLTAEERDQLKTEARAWESWPGGDSRLPFARQLTDRLICFYNSYGGGDRNYRDYIYTDDDGVDHLVKAEYSDAHYSCSYFGDRILGLHENCLIQWRDGFLIHRDQKAVLLCDDALEHAVIPDEVTALGVSVFDQKPKLKSLTIPAGVHQYRGAFSMGGCPELKTIRLAKELRRDPALEAELRKNYPQAEILYEE